MEELDFVAASRSCRFTMQQRSYRTVSRKKGPKNGWRQKKATRTTRNHDIEAVEVGGGERSTLTASSAVLIACSSSSYCVYNYMQNPSDMWSSNLTPHNL